MNTNKSSDTFMKRILRLGRLLFVRILVFTYPKLAVDFLYYRVFHKCVNWKDPKDYNEKVQWLMINTDTSEWTRLADKYLVKKYLEEKGLGKHTPKLYGVWDAPALIDLNILPEKFVLKCNHDCGSTKIIDKNKLTDEDWADIVKFYKRRVRKRFGIDTAELHYIKIPRKVIAEELIENDNPVSTSIVDYKFWCLDGNPAYCFVKTDVDLDTGERVIDIYDVKTWKSMSQYVAGNMKSGKTIPPPKNLPLMIDLCKELSKDFPQVRIDLYESKDNVYIGELTFTNNGGKDDEETEEFMMLMGAQVTLPSKS